MSPKLDTLPAVIGIDIGADLDVIERVPVPSGDLKAIAKVEIERLAASGAISVSANDEFAFPTRRFKAEVHNAQPGAIAFGEMPDVVALIAFLLKPTLIAAINGVIDASSDDRAALSSVDREKRASAVQLELLRTERDEAALVWAAQAQGMQIEHRADCAPIAILSCEIVTAPVREADDTSVEHAWDIVQPGYRR